MDVPVEWDKIITAVEAAMVAPSAGNLQVWRYVVVRKQEKRKQIAEACLQQYWMEQAPVHVVIVAKLEKEEQFYGKRGVDLYSVQDCAMAAMNVMLAAHDLGLGSCFVSAFDENALSRIFGLPETVKAAGSRDAWIYGPEALPTDQIQVRKHRWNRKLRNCNERRRGARC